MYKTVPLLVCSAACRSSLESRNECWDIDSLIGLLGRILVQQVANFIDVSPICDNIIISLSCLRQFLAFNDTTAKLGGNVNFMYQIS